MSASSSHASAVPEACLGLGANLGDREGQLAEALVRLAATEGITLTAISRVYRTAPWGLTHQPDFLNLCIRMETDLAPFDILRICKGIERSMGRKPREHWGPREIDVDVLLVEGVELVSEELELPHPRLAARRFVLEPLAEIVPDWAVAGKSVRELAERLRAEAPEQACDPDEAATEAVRARCGF